VNSLGLPWHVSVTAITDLANRVGSVGSQFIHMIRTQAKMNCSENDSCEFRSVVRFTGDRRAAW
jgi:hypothetical protein